MAETWIVNASPLIALGAIGRLDLLEASERTIVLPGAVVTEVLVGPATGGAHVALSRGWGAQRPEVSMRPEVLEWGLGSGESAVLSLAMSTSNAAAVLDDAAARRCARSLGIRLTGTLGVVLSAKLTGHIDSAATIVRSLRDAGLYLDTSLIREALQRIVGENWDDVP